MSKTTLLTGIFTINLILLAASGCYNDKENILYPANAAIDCNTKSAKFNDDVNPIMKNKCATAGCHNAATGAGGIVLENYSQVAAKAPRIKQRCIVEKSMPPGSVLSADEIIILNCWINSGSPNN